MRSQRHTALLIGTALLAGTVGAPGRADDATHGALALTQRKVGETFVVDGTFEVAVPGATVWAVLSDYDGLPAFVSSMRASAVRSRSGAGVVVEQRAVAKVLFLQREVRLRLEIAEVPGRTITFSDADRRDFEVYRGSWTVTEGEGRTRVAYHLEAIPRNGVPGFIGMPVLQGTASELLAEVRAEVLRRGANGGAAQANRGAGAVREASRETNNAGE